MRFNDGERVQALNGLGGVGKTQAALEYAYRYQANYSVIIWGNAHSRETLIIDFVAISGLLGLPEQSMDDQNLAVEAVKRWFAGNESWLLILDNADDLTIAREFIPLGKGGHVLITTRAQNTRPIAMCNVIEKMNIPDGATFLLRRLNKIKKNETLQMASADVLADAVELVKKVDGLPLALDQAAAFIEEIPSTLEEYLQLYKKERSKLLAHRGELTDQHPESVNVTFSLAFKKVTETNPTAAELLRICAFLDAGAIPEGMFLKEATRELWCSTTVNQLDLTKAIKEAGRFSLIRRNTKTSTLTIHRLVQDILREEMDDNEQCLWSGRAIKALNHLFPNVESINYDFCDCLIPHVEALNRADYNWQSDAKRELAQLLDKAALYLAARVQDGAAESLNTRALAIIFDSNHPTLSAVSSNLSQSLNSQLHLYTSKTSLNRTFTKSYNREDTGCLKSINSIKDFAFYFLNNSDWQMAEPLIDRVVTAYERFLGPRHPVLLQTIEEIVNLYLKGGNHCLPSSIQNSESFSNNGFVHTDVLRNSEGLLYDTEAKCAEADAICSKALAYEKQENYGEAEVFYRQALAIQEKMLGPQQPEMVRSLRGLAWSCQKQGKYSEAELFHRRVLVIQESRLGPDHPVMSETLYYLARCCLRQKNYAEALSLCRRSLYIREKESGSEHPSLSIIISTIATINEQLGNYSIAENLYHRVLAIQEKYLKPTSLEIASTLYFFALCYDKQGKYAQAESLYRKALNIQQNELGQAHYDVFKSAIGLSQACYKQGKYAEADLLDRWGTAAEISEDKYGNIAPIIHDLARLYYREGRYKEAELLYKPLLTHEEKVFGPEDSNVAQTIDALARIYCQQRRYDEAEPLYKQILNIGEKVFGIDHPSVATILRDYASLLRETGKNIEAEKLEERAMNIMGRRPAVPE